MATRMIRSLALGAVLCALAVPAAAQQATIARANGATLRGLDKISGQTTDLAVPVGDEVKFGRLQVRLGECRYPAEDPSADAWALLSIADANAGKTIFNGWMIASSPALSALDHARYDIWVVSCDTAT